MNKIIVPTDFSECSSMAVEIAKAIAAKNDISLVFLHDLAMPIDWENLPKEKEDNYPELKAKIELVQEKLDELVAGAGQLAGKVEGRLSHSETQACIVDSLENEDYDLIVIGSHGWSGSKKVLIGSIAERTMRRATTPVLVVKELQEEFSFKKVVYASGLEDDTHEAFRKFLAFADAVGTEEIHFVGVTTPYNFKPTGEILKRIESFVARHERPNIQLHNYNHFTIEAGILEFANLHDVDLIAISNHGRFDITSLFVESIPENLIKYGHLPVLSIRV